MGTAGLRPRPAAQHWEICADLRASYAYLYSQDAQFQRALLELYAAHCAAQEPFLASARDLWAIHEATWRGWPPPRPGAEWASGYLDAVAETARRFGLQRLGRPKPASKGSFQPSSGEQLIHTWCSERAMALQHGRDWPPDRFFTGAESGGARPEVGEVVLREEIPVSGPGGERVVIIDERRKPLIHVLIEDAWDPRNEPRAKARKRLLVEATRQIDAELERIAADATGQGYVFQDRDDAERDLTWLFWKARHRLSYGQIVQRSEREHPRWLRKGRKRSTERDPQQDTERVKKAVVRMAKRVGIDRTGW